MSNSQRYNLGMKLKCLQLLLVPFLLIANLAWAQGVKIAVAANMKDAFGEIAQAFKAINQSELQVVYGSSGNFAAQIQNGAPFHLLIAADEHFPLQLYKSGLTINEGVIYAIGQLVLLVNSDSGIGLPDGKVNIAKAITKANKVAIAKPELAPYGKAAMEYLKAEGFWDLAKNKLVYGDNVGVATTYVVSGAADLGFTALSLAKSPQISKATQYVLLDNRLYEPIKQRMTLMKGAPMEAQSLYQFMQSAQAKTIMQKYGYITP